MLSARWWVALGGVSMFIVGSAHAQQAVRALLGPPAYKPYLAGTCEWRGFETHRVADSELEEDVAWQELSLRGDYRQTLNRSFERLLSIGLTRYEIQTDLWVPGTTDPMPDRFWDLELSTGVKQTFKDGHAWGIVGSLGSPSDKPFRTMDEVVLGATAFYLIPASGERNRWVLFLNYSNQRSFLNHVPLPGAAYLWSPSRNTFAMVGLPAAYFRTAWASNWSMDLFFFPPLQGDARVAYRWRPNLESYVRIRSDRDAFLRAGRTEADAWLRHAVIQAETGLSWSLGDHVEVDISMGYAFDRKIYESDSFSDRDHELELDPGAFAALTLTGKL